MQDRVIIEAGKDFTLELMVLRISKAKRRKGLLLCSSQMDDEMVIYLDEIDDLVRGLQEAKHVLEGL